MRGIRATQGRNLVSGHNNSTIPYHEDTINHLSVGKLSHLKTREERQAQWNDVCRARGEHPHGTLGSSMYHREISACYLGSHDGDSPI